MDDVETLAHTTWECKYHVVFIPKYRRKALFGQLRKDLGGVLRRLAEQKECRVEEGHLMADHVHMLVSIPPKYAVSQVVGYLKGKSAIHIARTYLGRRQNYVGQHFWARGYFVSTVGRDEAAVRERRLNKPDSPVNMRPRGRASAGRFATPIAPRHVLLRLGGA
jgi:putative transposase